MTASTGKRGPRGSGTVRERKPGAGMTPSTPGVWRVLDYDGNPLPGSWQTEEDAVDKGLAGKYLLSGHEVTFVAGEVRLAK